MAIKADQPTHSLAKPPAENKSSQAQKKKRKKKAPDKPQPAWLFPPNEENPVVNSKPKPEAQQQKGKAVKAQSLEFLEEKSVSAPKKAPPPGLLLTLVGGFLSSYGFDGASRLYKDHCLSRKKRQAWDLELDAKLPKGMPDLVRVFDEWYKEWKTKSQDESGSTSSDADVSIKQYKKASRASKSSGKTLEKKTEDTSTSGSSESSSDDSNSLDSGPKSNLADGVKKATKGSARPKSSPSPTSSSSSDIEAEIEKPATAGAKPKKTPEKAASSSESSTSSESDTDDEKETARAKRPPQKPTVNGLTNKLKRKASTSESTSADSEPSSSSSNSEAPPMKKTRVEAKKKDQLVAERSTREKATATRQVEEPKYKKAETSSSSGSSSSESSSDIENPANKPLPASSSATSSSDDSSSSSGSEATPLTKLSEKAKKSKPTKVKLLQNQSSDAAKSSDSSATLNGAVVKTSASESNAAASPTKTEQQEGTKRKRSLSPHSNRAAMTPAKSVKKEKTYFQRIPKDTKIDPKLASNKYINYDYAERAHRDLSVTKGKYFTKEKNKKKRGSYRGGMIDVDGRKGIKFDD